MIKFNSSFTFNFNPDSFFQKSPSGISYRIPKKWIDLFNQHIKRVAENAADVAKSNTPYSYFQNAWTHKTSIGGGLGIIEKIVVFNTKARESITFMSKVSNSGKTYELPVISAITMLELGRKKNYRISAYGPPLTIPNGAGGILFRRYAEIKSAPKPTKPVTKSLQYMKSAINALFKGFKAEGIENTVLSRVGTRYAGSYTKVIKNKTRNFRGK